MAVLVSRVLDVPRLDFWRQVTLVCVPKELFMDDKQHWERVYSTKSAEAVSWYQPSAERSLALIRRVAPSQEAPIIDVGGGASTLIDDLVTLGYRDLTVLDLASSALANAKARLGPAAARVQWLESDVRSADLETARYEVWHDRAVFHFLTDPVDRAAYVAQAMRSVKPGGFIIVATFAEDGPTKCSGLPVMRYSAEELHAEFGPSFELLATEREIHDTPTGAQQAFVYCLCRRTGTR